MRRIALALLASAVLPAPAHAATDLITVNLSDGMGHWQPIYAFEVDSAPTPDAVHDSPGFSYFEIDNVKLIADPTNPAPPASPADLLFFDQITGGAFSTADFVTISYFGTQLFDGPVEAPTFRLGTSDISGALDGTNGTITISQVVPEPATWLLTIAGFAMFGGGLWRPRSLRAGASRLEARS